jgi:flavin reductase (DIM6/NTAB) family NADH-FMN oxidoreductase RutF
MFSSHGRKDSVEIAEATGEFVCNFVGETLFKAMSQTSFAYDRGISEFAAAGLAEAECRIVKAPRVAEAPAALECLVTEIRRVRALSGETANWMVCGEVVGVHIDDAMLTDGLFDLARAKPVTRLGYLDYGLHPEIVTLPRPKHG